jgi:hypothetical protein
MWWEVSTSGAFPTVFTTLPALDILREFPNEHANKFLARLNKLLTVFEHVSQHTSTNIYAFPVHVVLQLFYVYY